MLSKNIEKFIILATTLILVVSGCTPKPGVSQPSPTPGVKASPTAGLRLENTQDIPVSETSQNQESTPGAEALPTPEPGETAVPTDAIPTEEGEEIEEEATVEPAYTTDFGAVIPFAEERSGVNAFAASANKIWVGSPLGELDIYKTSDGSYIKTVKLLEGSVNDVKYDGSQVWVLVTPDDDINEKLFVVDGASDEILTIIDIPESTPIRLSFTNNRIWLGDENWYAFDIASRALIKSAECPGACESYAADDKGHVWVTTAEGLLVLNASNLDVIATEDRTEPLSYLAFGGGYVWGVGSPPYDLEEYYDPEVYPNGEPAALMSYSPSDPNAAPNQIVILQNEYGTEESYPVDFMYDGKYLWILEDTLGIVRKHNPSTGKLVDSIQIVTQEKVDEYGDTPLSMSSDGKNLWVLTPYELIKING
jgi:hypothetical protein